MFSDLLTKVILAVAALILGAVVTWLISAYNQAKSGPYGVYFKYLVGALCDAAEVWFDGPGMGKQKLEWVIGLLETEAAKNGIPFDAVAVSAMIEQYVDEVINAGKTTNPVPTSNTPKA